MDQLDIRSLLWPLSLTVMALGGCGADPPAGDDPSRGAVHVLVVGPESEPIADALVTTSPASMQRYTDATGRSFLFNLEPGSYLVTASHPAFGAAGGSVEVLAGQPASLQLTLPSGPGRAPDAGAGDPGDDPDCGADDPGDDPDGGPGDPGDDPDGGAGDPGDDPDGGAGGDPNAPTITLLEPTEPAVFTQGDEIRFAATITDDDTPAAGITVEWRSHLEGVLDTQPLGPESLSEFTTTSMSVGMHQVTVTATDGDGYESSATVAVAVNLPAVEVTLYPLTRDPNAIELSWSQPGIPDGFTTYRVYRATAAAGPFQIIQVISDIEATQHRDATVSSGTTYFYQVGLTRAGASETRSNIQSIAAGVYIDMGTQVEAMIADPARGYLYALDRVNNSLHFVNLATAELESSIFVGSSPTAMDVSVAGNELFIANFGSTEIAVVDLETQQKTRSVFVNPNQGIWDGNPYRIACTANDTFVFTSQDQWNDLKLVDATTGANLTATGSLYQPGLVSNADGTRLYVAESGYSGSQLHRYNVGTNTLTHVDQSTGVGYGSNVVIMSGDGSTIFYASRKFLANNLASILGTFSEGIYATNHDGTLAIGSQNIWDGQTFSILRPLPFSTTVMAFDAGQGILYLYQSQTSRIYLYSVADL